ncbi:MAG: anaerobic ribonucleoside-triphosphate reductase [Kiritimatiellae bacterium]|jgi:anaerobic ribonucleoside-triphosphate reductase|nr:anaerobic ribonucleoside-triphosphate reductase [Kiritimatiellia bacterium]MDD4341481.1 anaerobic ribonucleoside-triphosphate reductase [Kiritimatiellia bacterium]MDY0149449.1 anaerobic ribonucleoside-triphosphate reductase [Kiritimatiellia bacterium]
MSKATVVGFDGFRKRDGLIVPFSRDKIIRAIYRAADEVRRRDHVEVGETMPEQMADIVIQQLNDPRSEYHVSADEQGRRIPLIEDIQDLIEIVLAEQGYAPIVAAYKRFRKHRQLARERIRVRTAARAAEEAKPVDLTDASMLMVDDVARGSTLPWDRRELIDTLVQHTDLNEEVALNIAKTVENQIIASGMRSVDSTLIRELLNNELSLRGYRHQLRDLSLYGVSRQFVDRLMYAKSLENSNIVNNNPEAVQLGIAELVLKQWALDTIFSADLKHAHNTGAIHLHDLGYPHRVYCSSHSVEYVKKYGLKGLNNLNNESAPASSAHVLTGHLNTFVASMQANYAGALGLAYINIMFAPYLRGKADKEIYQIAQGLIFGAAQNAFSRGGQTIFLDFNIHTGVPSYLKSVPAVGPCGRYMLRRADGEVVRLEEVIQPEKDTHGNPMMELWLAESDDTRRCVLREVADARHGQAYDPDIQQDLVARGDTILTYGDFEEEARALTRALLEVWEAGDANEHVFEFPKCDFHVSAETFSDPEQIAIYQRACEVASRNGSVYFIFDRDEVTLSACCRLRTTIEDNYMLRHPESLRFCGFQNVTVNIPQCMYRAARAGQRTYEGLVAEVDKMIDMAVKAHEQKRTRIAEMMSAPGFPLWQIGKTACDGKPYVELDKATYIIGLIGVNDAVKFLTGQEFHESAEALRLGEKLIAHMFLRCKKLSVKHKMKLTLEESPAESAARRLAKADLVYYRDDALQVVKGGDEDVAYYTNSIHLSADAPVSLVERIRQQAKFHSLIESGAITHAFIGEERPSPGAIEVLMRETFFRTQSAQVTLSPEFTYCLDCGHNMRGLQEQCTQCGSVHVEGETRVVGYFSKIQNWNKSKRGGELPARQRGRYAVEGGTVVPPTPTVAAVACAPAPVAARQPVEA